MTLDRFIVQATADAFRCELTDFASRPKGHHVSERMWNARRVATRVLKSFWYTSREVQSAARITAGHVATLHVESFAMDGDPRLEAVQSSAFEWAPLQRVAEDPIEAVSNVFGVTIEEVAGSNRQRRTTLARSTAVAMYRAAGETYVQVRAHFARDINPRHAWLSMREWADGSPELLHLCRMAIGQLSPDYDFLSHQTGGPGDRPHDRASKTSEVVTTRSTGSVQPGFVSPSRGPAESAAATPLPKTQ